MTINEIAKEVNMTKRAIKFYEEKGLLTVAKDSNGYRNYTEDDVEKLRKISVYRKLGIGISDIHDLIKERNTDLLNNILKNKEKELKAKTAEYEELKQFITTGKIENVYEEIQYETIADAIKDAVPGFSGYYFLNHFLPYLQGKIETEEQKKAYEEICAFWDETEIKIPLFLKISGWISYRTSPKLSAEAMVKKIDAQIKLYLDPSEEQYEKLKRNVWKGYRIKRMMRWHPAYVSQRRFMRELQNKGYNDIFITNMKKLSPDYKKYHDALTSVNQRICSDLGLYYDTNYNLIRKKGGEKNGG